MDGMGGEVLKACPLLTWPKCFLALPTCGLTALLATTWDQPPMPCSAACFQLWAHVVAVHTCEAVAAVSTCHKWAPPTCYASVRAPCGSGVMHCVANSQHCAWADYCWHVELCHQLTSSSGSLLRSLQDCQRRGWQAGRGATPTGNLLDHALQER